MERKYIKPKTAEKLAKDIIQWLIDNELWGDIGIYVNGRRYSNRNPKDGHYHYEQSWDNVFIEEDKEPWDYVEYAAQDHILSMSFEGALCHILNYYYDNIAYCDKMIEEFNKMFEKYSMYYEFGHHWNLTVYPL